MYQPLQHDAKACQSQVKRVATVVFYCGDEVLRQWYKRYTWLELVPFTACAIFGLGAAILNFMT